MKRKARYATTAETEIIQDPWEVLGFNGEVPIQQAEEKYKSLRKNDKRPEILKAIRIIRELTK